jgi:IS30 family transposase
MGYHAQGMLMRHTYSQIDMDERRRIARWRAAGLSATVIAEKLGRHRSTIFRELKRNAFEDPQMPELSGYYCVTANEMARERRAKLRKLARFSHVRQSVIERIMHGWSPQQIAGRDADRGMLDGVTVAASARNSTSFTVLILSPSESSSAIGSAISFSFARSSARPT